MIFSTYPEDIGDLNVKAFTNLTILTCHGGDIDIQDNVARTFLENQEITNVDARDGPLSFTYFGLEPRMSNEGYQDYIDTYGHEPQGMITYQRTDNDQCN